MSTDIYLKFADRAAMETALLSAGWTVADPGTGEASFPDVARHGGALVDVLGAIRTPAVVDTDGTEIAPPEAPAGWHVNVRLRQGAALPAPLQPFVLDPAPATPHRRFV